MSKNFGTSEELVDELILEIDRNIESRIEKILQMTKGDDRTLQSIIQTMLTSNNPEYTKLALFLKNYRQESMKTDMQWMRDEEPRDSDSDSSERVSPGKLSPTKSIGERFSPIRLREF